MAPLHARTTGLAALLRSHVFSAADCPRVYQRREPTPPRKGCSRSAMFQVFSRGSALMMSRCVPLPSVCSEEASPRLRVNLHMPEIHHLARSKSTATAVEDLLWSAASSRAGTRDPGSLVRLTQASADVAGVLCVSLFPQRRNILRRVPYPGSLLAKYVRLPWLPCLQGVQGTGSRYAGLRPRHLFLQVARRSGTGRRDRRSRIGGSDISLPLAPWKRFGGGAGNPGPGKDCQLRWHLRHPGLRPALRSCFHSRGQHGEQAASLPHCCCRSPPSAWTRLTRAWTSRRSLTTPCRRCCGSFHFVVAPHFSDPQHVCGIPKSTARTRGLHPSQVERMRIANLLLGSEQQRRVALCVHGRGDFLFCPEPAAGVGARPTDFRLPSVDTSRSTLSHCFGRSTSRHWKRSSAVSGAQSTPFLGQRWSAAATRTPLGSEGSICSALPLACCSSFVNTHLAAIVPDHLRGRGTQLGRGARQRRVQAVVLRWHGNGHA